MQLWHVFVFAALLGIANAVETPVRQAFVSELVGTPLLPNALSLYAAAFNSARIVGPAVAGLAIAAFDVGPVFLITALSSLAPLVSVVRMRPAELHREALLPRDERASARIIDGLRYVLAPPRPAAADGADVGDRHDRCSTSSSPWPRWPRPCSTPAPPRSACSPPRWRSARWAARWPAPVGAAGPSVWLVLGAAIALRGFGTLVGLAPTYWLVVMLLVPTGFFMIFFAQAANQRVQLGVDAAFRGRVMAL